MSPRACAGLCTPSRAAGALIGGKLCDARSDPAVGFRDEAAARDARAIAQDVRPAPCVNSWPASNPSAPTLI